MGKIRVVALTVFTAIILTQTSPVIAYNDQGDLLWQKTYGGAGDDCGYSVKELPTGGYVAAGYTTSFGAGGKDVYLIRTNSSGQLIWQRTFGGPDNDTGFCVQITPDGGLIIAGSTLSFGKGENDVYLVKTDSEGILTWSKTFGGFGNDTSSLLQVTEDGGYIIVGSTDSLGSGKSDVYLVKTDSDGNLEWQQTYGGQEEDYGSSITIDEDGGYTIAGTTRSYGAQGSDVLLLKIDASGNQVWMRTIGGSNDDSAYSLRRNSKGGYVVSGSTGSFGVGDAKTSDGYIVVTDSVGLTLLNRTFGIENRSENSYSTIETPSGGYTTLGMVGAEFLYEIGSSVYLQILDSEIYGGIVEHYGGNRDDNGYSLEMTSDGGYIITGSTESFGGQGLDVYLINVYDRYTTHPIANAGSDLTLIGTYTAHITEGGSLPSYGSRIVSYEWDLGDGTRSDGRFTITHTYPRPGIYTATLTVTDDKGQTSTDSITVTVKPMSEVYTIINATLTLNYVSDSSIGVTMVNHKAPIVTGEPWWIERYVGGDWVQWHNTGTFIAIAYPLPTGGHRDFTISFHTSSLPNGLFRVGKDYFLDNNYRITAIAYAEFNVTGSIVPDTFPLSPWVFILILLGLLLLIRAGDRFVQRSAHGSKNSALFPV